MLLIIPQIQEIGQGNKGNILIPDLHIGNGITSASILSGNVITINQRIAEIYGNTTFIVPCTIKDVDLSFIRTPFLLVFRNTK